MNQDNAHPTRDDLLVMAYVDDELAADQRKLLQSRLAKEPELARQVAVYQKLAVLAQQVAPPEPMDLEWERIRKSPAHRSGLSLGWLLLTGGVLGLLAWGCYSVLVSDLSMPAKLFFAAAGSGFGVLLLIRLRDRLRLIPFDPYTEVQR